MNIRLRSAAALLCCAAATALGAWDSDACKVDVRGEEPIEGRLLVEDSDGIEVEVSAGGTVLRRRLGWHQIRALRSDATSGVREERLRTGALLWRGRARLERGDLLGAREMLLKARAQVGPEAARLLLLADEGLAATAPIDPAHWTDSLAAALRIAAHAQDAVGSAVDDQAGVVLSVPPAWSDGDSAQHAYESLSRSADEARRSQDTSSAQLLECAARIAAADAGIPADPPKVAQARPGGKPGLRLIAAWADGVSSDAAARRRGRDAIKQVLRGSSGALRAWALYALGRSLVMEDEAESVRHGAGQMLTVPAAHAKDSPWLARCAVDQSAIALARIHDDESAARLREVVLHPAGAARESKDFSQGDDD